MLDVHPPHEKIHGFRDFLLHLLTITVGLLIALGLEGSVEALHRRELRHEAEKNLRQEVQDNLKEIVAGNASVVKEEKNLTGALDFIQARKAGKTHPVSQDQLSIETRALSDASWRTASATGALALLEYDTVQAYAGVYQTQEQWTRLAQETLEDYLKLEFWVVYGLDPARFPPAVAAAAEPDVRLALAHLVAMREVGDGLAREYQKLLKR